MKRPRIAIKLALLGLIVGGLGNLFVLPASFTLPLTSHRRIEPSSSEQTKGELSIQELLETTYLGRPEQYPDPGEPEIVLKKYVERDTHRYLEGESEQMEDLDREITEWEILVRDHSDSRHALARLAELYRNKAELTQSQSGVGFRPTQCQHGPSCNTGL